MAALQFPGAGALTGYCPISGWVLSRWEGIHGRGVLRGLSLLSGPIPLTDVG